MSPAKMDTTDAIHTYHHSCHPSLLKCGFVPIITITRFIYRCNCSEYFVMYWTSMTFHGHGFELVSGVAHTYLYLHTIEVCMPLHGHAHAHASATPTTIKNHFQNIFM